jgi:hypothetical protein
VRDKKKIECYNAIYGRRDSDVHQRDSEDLGHPFSSSSSNITMREREREREREEK